MLFTDDEAWNRRTEVMGSKSYIDVLWACGSYFVNFTLEYTSLILNFVNLLKRNGEPMQVGAGKATLTRIGEIRISKIALESKIRAVKKLVVKGHKDYEPQTFNC